MEKQTITLNGTPVSVKLRRHRLARRTSLRMNASGDGVVITLSPRGSEQKALAFLRQKADWVLQHMQKSRSKTVTAHEAVIPVLGEEITIHHQPGRGVTRLENGILHVSGDAAFTARRVNDFLKKHAHQYALGKSKELAKTLGTSISALKLREMESRWGSCSASGSLTLNWRLVFAPREVLDYVIAHEVAHRLEMNHGPRFWSHVASLCPDYMKQRRWLKQHGQELYSWG